MLYSILATPYFESKITVYPAGTLVESGNVMNNLQGIAESFGLGGVSNNQTFNIPDIVDSRRLKKSIILNKWETSKFTDKVNLITFWELDKPNIFNPRKFIKRLLPFSAPLKDTLGAQLFEALEKINDAIEITSQKTINFAKRQRTWFRNKNNPYWLDNKNPLKDAIIKIQSTFC